MKENKNSLFAKCCHDSHRNGGGENFSFNISLRVQIKSISQLDATSMGFSLCGKILRHIFARVDGKLSCASNFCTISIAFN